MVILQFSGRFVQGAADFAVPNPPLFTQFVLSGPAFPLRATQSAVKEPDALK